MASSELIIDDDFCKAIGAYFIKQGQQLDQRISEYITILQDVRNKVLISGEVADALTSYITYVQKLNKQMGDISTNVDSQIKKFLSRVDSADQYLF